MEKRTEVPTLYITGQGRVGIETAKRLGDIVGLVHPKALGGLTLSGGTNMADVFQAQLDVSGKRDEAVMLHIFSYDRDNAQAITDEVASAKEQFPEVFHFGVVSKPVDPLSSRYFRQTEKQPLESLGIPLTVLDEGKAVRIEERRKSDIRFKPEDVVFYGMVGLFKGHATFPELNPHTPREILESLTDQTNLIGISVGQQDHYYPLRKLPIIGIPIPFLGRHHVENEFSRKIDDTIRDVLYGEYITPFERANDVTPNVLALQIPLDPEDSKWNRAYIKSFEEEAVKKGGFRLAVNSLVVVASPVMTPLYDGMYVVSTAALFYPAKGN